MARAIWTGVITFGLASVPVGLYTATEDHTVRFHQLQRSTADRIRNRRVNERTGKEVASEDIVKGFEAARASTSSSNRRSWTRSRRAVRRRSRSPTSSTWPRWSRCTSPAPTTSPRAARST